MSKLMSKLTEYRNCVECKGLFATISYRKFNDDSDDFGDSDDFDRR